ncbi:unnamed protein product, partial [Durusdinium trenchii]
MESSVRTKLLAGAAQVCIQTSVGILYKVSQAATGGFKYSTTSAICMAEFVKLLMSASFHVLDRSHSQAVNLQKAWSNARDQLSYHAVGHIYILALLYMINNQLSFYIYTLVDPGTVFLFKAASTMIVATVQCTFAGKKFSWEQWKAMMLQACGMITVQYDPCKGAGVYSVMAYTLLCLSTAITAVSAARNEFLVKNFQITLNVQNSVLYSGGVLFNLFAFLFLPNPNNKDENTGFFDGYDFLAILVVCSNALIGIVITAVYKYADAVVKCIASDITAVLLIIISTIFFGLTSSLTMWCGVFTVTFAVHLYIDSSAKAAEAGKAKEERTTPSEANVTSQA